MKYIVLKQIGKHFSREVPIIFPNELVHSVVAEAIMDALEKEGHKTGFDVVSAGEFSSMDIQADCNGKSTTLNVKSRGDVDSRMITMYDYLHGIE